ncbi:MAG: radical SAM protein [Firmicutes bacterium]|nr:radical SAM protein [Bacillota bacterium]
MSFFKKVQPVREKNHPRKFKLQWHINESCNLRCRHCYQEGYSSADPPLEELLTILKDFINFLEKWNKQEGSAGAHINITGGEPFLREDFFDFLEILNTEFRDKFSFGILTNGTLITEKSAQKLKKLHTGFVQVSMEGSGETHDSIRGKGSYIKAAEGLKHLVNAGVPSLISFTANRENFREFGYVAELGKKLGVSRVWADRMIPSGCGSDMGDVILTPAETMEFFRIMKESGKKSFLPWKNNTEVQMCRALQFLEGGGMPYSCSAGDTLITIMHDGTFLPCRRMPIPLGNLKHKSFEELYFKTPFLDELRDKNKPIKGCEKCRFLPACRGGLKCLSYAVKQTSFAADPGCPLSNPAE